MKSKKEQALKDYEDIAAALNQITDRDIERAYEKAYPNGIVRVKPDAIEHVEPGEYFAPPDTKQETV